MHWLRSSHSVRRFFRRPGLPARTLSPVVDSSCGSFAGFPFAPAWWLAVAGGGSSFTSRATRRPCPRRIADVGGDRFFDLFRLLGGGVLSGSVRAVPARQTQAQDQTQPARRRKCQVAPPRPCADCLASVFDGFPLGTPLSLGDL